MSDSFVPLIRAPVPSGEAGALHLKVLTEAEAKTAFEPLPAGRPEPPATTCRHPSVTLQRQGDVVTGIRVECGCGQVIELVCAY